MRRHRYSDRQEAGAAMGAKRLRRPAVAATIFFLRRYAYCRRHCCRYAAATTMLYFDVIYLSIFSSHMLFAAANPL